MSALSDCFTASGVRMTVGDALARFSAGLHAVTVPEPVALREAAGRILAEDLVADRPIPPHDNAAVDGFAVYFDDLDEARETRIPVTGRIAAGHPLGRAASPGEALQIFTGAPMPEGPDTIYMMEDCQVEGDHVRLPPGIRRGDNCRRAGEDVASGDLGIGAGSRLRAQDVAMAAALGQSRLQVYGRLRVAVFSTGDEIRDPGDTIDDGCIFDTNRYSVMSMLEGLGCAVSDLGILRDELPVVRGALAEWKDKCDLILTSGGVSMGEEDHVKTAVGELGSIDFWNLAIKPGRPIALGCLAAGETETPFIGLPGNPVAAMVTFLRVARPIVMLLSGATAIEPHMFRVPAAFDFHKKTGRREWLRVRLQPGGSGHLEAVKFPAEGSGILSSMVAADGLVELGEDDEVVNIGQLVDFLPFSEVLR